MAQSLSKVYLHVVFSTKERISYIFPELEERIHSYIVSICKDQGYYVHAINGMEDHIHILLEQSRTVTISKLVEAIKSNSSRWIKLLDVKLSDFAWQGGYGVFSVDHSTLNPVEEYIKNQKEHHKKRDFKEELLLLLKRANVVYDERYLWD